MFERFIAVADPGLQIRRGGARSQKKFFLALRTSVSSKNKGGGEGTPPPTPGPPLYSRLNFSIVIVVPCKLNT